MSLALTAAMAGGALMGVSAPAQAVNIAQDGLGEVLVFPYYTTRADWATFFNITNTSDKTVIAKVRWREGVNSREVRDFNVILSPYDVWTAATVNTADGARMITSDNSCTAPLLTNNASATGGQDLIDPNLSAGSQAGLTGINFTNLAYSGALHGDGGSASLDRTREGYFTVIEMGVAATEGSPTPFNALHVGGAGGNTQKPRNCAAIVALTNNNFPLLAAEFNEPQNVLKGRAVLINFNSGVAAGYDPTVLANFYNPLGIDGVSVGDNIVEIPASDFPNLNNAFPPQAQWIDDTPGVGPSLQTVTAAAAIGAPYNIGNGRPVDAVSVLFNRQSVINDYNVADQSATDWIVTSPTKRYYVDEANSVFAAINPEGPVAPLQPFDGSVAGEEFDNGPVRGTSCFDIRLNVWDREEYKAFEQTNLQFSPPLPGSPGDKLCYETNVISFENAVLGTNVLGSNLRLPVPSLPALNGWAELTFGATGDQSLPVIGLRVEQRAQDTSFASYGFAHNHSYKRGTLLMTQP